MTTATAIPIDALPRRTNGTIPWKNIFAGAAAGDVHTWLARSPAQAISFRAGVSNTASKMGIPHRTKVVGRTITLTVIERPATVTAAAIGASLYHQKSQMVQDLNEARRELAYWQRQKALRPPGDSRTQAGARVLVWTTTLASREAALKALPSES